MWPWAEPLLEELGGAQPEVLSAADGIDFEAVAALEPDLIVGTNAGLTEKDYELLSAIAPTVTSVEGSTQYFSSVARPDPADRPRARPRGRRPGARRRASWPSTPPSPRSTPSGGT